MNKVILNIIFSLFLISCKKVKNNEVKEDIIKKKINISEEQQESFQPKKNTIVNNLLKVDAHLGDKLDAFLDCDNYAYMDEFYRIPDYGCPYNPKYNAKNTLGWADVVLLLKDKDKDIYKKFSDDEIYSKEDFVSGLTYESKKSDYIPIIFLIEKEYLKYRKNVEVNCAYSPSLGSAGAPSLRLFRSTLVTSN